MGKFDKYAFKLAAASSFLNGPFLAGSILFGFGNYISLPYYRGGMATYGQISRFALIFLFALGVSILFSGFGFRKIARVKKDSIAFLKFLVVAITSVALFLEAGLLTMAHPYYIDGVVGPYWFGCFFTGPELGYTFTILTFFTFALLGLCQILWGKALMKQNGHSKNVQVRILGFIQMLSGVVCLGVPVFLLIFFPSVPVLLSLLFAVGQFGSVLLFLFQMRRSSKEAQV